MENCVLHISRGLLARGHAVEVVTLDRDLQDGTPFPRSETVDSIPVHRIPYFGSRRYPIAPSWMRHIRDFDVIHIHGIDFFVDSAAAGRRLGLHSSPVVVSTHGGIFHTSAWRSLKQSYWKSVLKYSLGAVETVVAVSDIDASLFQSIVPPHKLVTIPNGIDVAFRRARADRVRGRLVCVGRVSRSKRIDNVIRLVAAVADDFPDVELLVIGPDLDGTGGALMDLASQFGLAARVRILGQLPMAAMASLVASAHLYISAAPHEGFAITTVEAMSAGIPVLVTRTGIHERVVRDALSGWFWSGSPDQEASQKFRHALTLSDARLDEMQNAARTLSAPFDWDLSTDDYERVLESACRKSAGGPRVPGRSTEVRRRLAPDANPENHL
jgi:alpha-1,3-mannosyltransferase